MLKAVDYTKGRRQEEDYEVKINNDPFLEDVARIRDCAAYRRLAHKTQVISSPKDTFVRTRASHTDEVVSVSLYIASGLGLNVHLCMAIAEGHDIGHAPYGHLGESALTRYLGKKFQHSIAGVVAAQKIENKGQGLNLSFETLEGILHHSRTRQKELTTDESLPNEYAAVMYADKIAYTLSDLNDAMRCGYLDKGELPKVVSELGEGQKRRQFTILKALISESKEKGRVSFSEGRVFEMFAELRTFMHDEFYYKVNTELRKKTLELAYEFFSNEPRFEGVDPALALFLLTDVEASFMGEVFKEVGRCTVEDLRGFSIFDYIPNFAGAEIDLTDADLGWGSGRELMPLGS